MHGAAFATFAGVARNGFRYLSGESDVTIYASSKALDRVFCSHCGTNIMVSTKDESGAIYLSMGAIDGDPPRPPGYHIYVGSKASWYEIQDDLPQFETEPKVWP